MTRLVCISDTHGSYRALTLPSGDILVHAGDWNARGSWQEVKDFLAWFESQPHAHKVFIAGNHDTVTEREPEAFAKARAKYAPSAIYLNDSGVEIEGLKFWGSPVSPRFFDWAWNRDRGPAIQAHWDLIPADTEVLITHGPPMGILDYVPPDIWNVNQGQQHVGCANLMTTINERLPNVRAHIFGHVHMPGGKIEHRGERVYVNASVLNDAYVLVNQPIVIVV